MFCSSNWAATETTTTDIHIKIPHMIFGYLNIRTTPTMTPIFIGIIYLSIYQAIVVRFCFVLGIKCLIAKCVFLLLFSLVFCLWWILTRKWLWLLKVNELNECAHRSVLQESFKNITEYYCTFRHYYYSWRNRIITLKAGKHQQHETD